MMPFWFWNDDVEEAELLRQVRAFDEHGITGFIIHARMGLSRRVGYLTPEYFRLVRSVVEEAARRGMKVVLYDEGAYPSGSAQGRVVRDHPEYAARGLQLVEHRNQGPYRGYWRPSAGGAFLDRLVTVVMGREVDEHRIDPASLRVLSILEPGLVRVEVPEGSWRLMACFDVATGGTIRGVFEDEEDRSATAPPAADLMNSDAVARFIRLTHDAYYEHLKDHFGTTVIAMFTDEPSPLGRGPKRGGGLMPYTHGLVEDLAADCRMRVADCGLDDMGVGTPKSEIRNPKWRGDPRLMLPSLWLDLGPDTARFREIYDHAVNRRVREVFYRAQSEWCATHGIALTGHPHASHEMTCLRWFQWPGQDTVWRWVLPDHPSALEGPNSVAAKAASSGARAHDRRRNATEVAGAYGWGLTLDEMKWLVDWHLVRGNNLFFPHALFYSVRGPRAYERPPDLGMHNLWWPYFRLLADYVRRGCWVLSDGEHVCSVGVVGDGEHLPWAAAKIFYQHQIDFNYLDDQALGLATVRDGHLHVARQSYAVLVVDGQPTLSDQAMARLREFEGAGGRVFVAEETQDLLGAIQNAVRPDVITEPSTPDLRVLHYRKRGLHFYLLVNEGEEILRTRLHLHKRGTVEAWDLWTGRIAPVNATALLDGIEVEVHLPRRESIVLAILNRGRTEGAEDVEPPPIPSTSPQGSKGVREQGGKGALFCFSAPLLLRGGVREGEGLRIGPAAAPVEPSRVIPIQGPWTVTNGQGASFPMKGLGNWTRVPEVERFAGTVEYATTFTLGPKDLDHEVWLDLGEVGDFAAVRINGREVGVRLWKPFLFDVRGMSQGGENRLHVAVTNSLVNYYEGAMRPSGLMGPVQVLIGDEGVRT